MKRLLFRVSSVLVALALIIVTLQILFDVPVAQFLVPSSAGNAAGTELTAIFQDGVQKAAGSVEVDSYPSLIVQRGIPVEFTLKASADKINDCNKELLFPAFGITLKLTPGANIVRFTPQESGVFPFSCWMNMIKGTITVVESLGFATETPQPSVVEAAPQPAESSPPPSTSVSVEPVPGESPSVAAETMASATPEYETPVDTATTETPAPSPSIAPVFENKETDASLGGWLEDELKPGEGTEGVKEIRTWTGWLFDRDCVGISPVKHTKACNLMGSCIDSGLGIFEYVPGKAFDSYVAVETFLNFDGASKELAVAFLKALPKEWKNNITVTVTGYAVNNIPAAADELLIPETDLSRVDHYLNGIHITSIETVYIDGLSTNPLPEPNVVFTQP